MPNGRARSQRSRATNARRNIGHLAETTFGATALEQSDHVSSSHRLLACHGPCFNQCARKFSPDSLRNFIATLNEAVAPAQTHLAADCTVETLVYIRVGGGGALQVRHEMCRWLSCVRVKE